MSPPMKQKIIECISELPPLKQNIIECISATKGDSDRRFEDVRRLLLHHKNDHEALQSLPDDVVVKVLKYFTKAPRIKVQQAVEGVRILGMERAATLARADAKLLEGLRRIFEGKIDSDAFDVIDDEELTPDKAKAREVLEMQVKYKKEWPNLFARFQHGVASTDPEVVLNLVLETVDYILTPIKAMERSELHEIVSGDRSSFVVKKKPVIVVIGITGSGKSVACNWLAGRRIEKVPDIDEDGEAEGVRLHVSNPEFLVGTDNFTSKTFAPNVKVLDKFALIDFPGACDTSGVEIRIGMDLAFREMLKFIQPVHVLGLISIDSFKVGRGTAAKQQLSKLQRLLPTAGAALGADNFAVGENSSTWYLGVTKCDKDFELKPRSLFKDAVQFASNFDPGLAPYIFNMNDAMFSSDSECTVLVDKLLRGTRTSSQSGLEEGLVEKALGKVKEGDLISDCLNPNDMSLFGRVFMSEEFENAFIEHDVAQAKRCESFARANMTREDDSTWEAFSKLIDGQVEELCRYTSMIIEDSQNLIDHGTLSLERRLPAIKTLCSFMQCRLKLCFVEAEAKIMLECVRSSIELNDELYSSALQLKNEGFIRDPDFIEVVMAYEQSSRTMALNARHLGFKDTAALLQRVSRVSKATSTAGLVIGGCTALTSTTLPGYIAGIGTLSANATLGLATGGLALILGSAVYALAKCAKMMRAHGDRYSEQMKDKLKHAFEALSDANDAATKHKTALSAITSTLRSLEVHVRD